jgi:trimethylamine:corrinoid methyltransferase-like protein
MAAVLQLLGMAAIVAGAALIAPAAGFIVGGLALSFIGLALESARKGR